MNDERISINTFIHETLFTSTLGIRKLFIKPLLESVVSMLCDEIYKERKKDQAQNKEKIRLLISHSVSVLNKTKIHSLEFLEKGRLARQLSRYFLEEGQFIQANAYAKYAYDLEMKLKGKASTWTSDTIMDSSLFIGSFDLFNTALAQRKKSKDFDLAETLALEGFEKLTRGWDKEAANLFQEAIMTAQHLSTENSNQWIMHGLLALTSAAFDWKKSAQYLKSAEQMLLKEFSKESEEYARFLLIKAETHFKRPVEFTEDEETNETLSGSKTPVDLYFREAYESMLNFYSSEHPVMLSILPEWAISASRRGNWPDVLWCCETIEKFLPFLKQSVGDNHYSLANYQIAKALLAESNEDYPAKKLHLEQALSILNQFFQNDSENPQIQALQRALEELD